MDDGIKRRPVWILVMGVPSAVAALIAGLLIGASADFTIVLALTFGTVLGVLTFTLTGCSATEIAGEGKAADRSAPNRSLFELA